MMKIECLKKGKNVIKGSSELRIMQNNYTPVLDLLIRESLQNSLDAKKENADVIYVDYLHSSFNVDSVCSEIETVGDKIKNKYKSNKADYIAIMDKNTIGLTGDLSGDYEEKDKQNQNLGKLVFHIMEEQEREGAGGSWGIGKTLYYRLGIGLVIYYSRIRNNNSYQERLVAAIVEDETKKDGLLSSINGNVGVAWFGDVENGKAVKAITDSDYIKRFLSHFDLKPLTNNETGTYVIIPFIDEKKLLENNLSENAEEMWWNKSIEDYLYVSVLRWYFPRFSKYYDNGPKLDVHINGEKVEASDESNTVLYKKYIELYDAFYKNKPNKWIKVSKIERKTDLVTNKVGKFIYGLVDKNEIGVKKYHLPNPKQYALIDFYESSYPLVCYCRNAGMIINYETFNRNLGFINCPEDKYIIGLFVVDPNNSICCSPKNIKLDEYLRTSEKSDHSSWEDHPIPNYNHNIRIVDGIYKNIAKVLNADFGEEKKIETENTVDISLARKFGHLFLPDAGYGSDPRKAGSGSNGGGGFTKIGNSKIQLLSTKYKDGNLILGYEIVMKERVKYIKFDNLINTVGKKYNAIDWIEEGFEYPCNICQIGLQCIARNKKSVTEDVVFVEKGDEVLFEGYSIEFISTQNSCYSFVLNRQDNNNDGLIFKIYIEIENKDKSMQTYCNVEFGGK